MHTSSPDPETFPRKIIDIYGKINGINTETFSVETTGIRFQYDTPIKDRLPQHGVHYLLYSSSLPVKFLEIQQDCS